ncbi:hypothetical protein ILYODFUR_009510 [Ilyodon furcidens]|uniref:Uncharacterized protein n=1 Tax=Ilyodon furcidens TaxID=33524 RepID=A0ABV0UQQ3_9TELE
MFPCTIKHMSLHKRCYTKQSKLKNVCGQNGAHKKDKRTHLHTEIIGHLHTNNKAHTFSSHCSADGPLSNYSQPFSSPMCPCVFVDSTPPTVAISFSSHSSAATFTPHRNIHTAASQKHTQRQKQHC